MDPDNDRKISEHVLRMHRYRKPGEQEGEGEWRFNIEILLIASCNSHKRICFLINSFFPEAFGRETGWRKELQCTCIIIAINDLFEPNCRHA